MRVWFGQNKIDIIPTAKIINLPLDSTPIKKRFKLRPLKKRDLFTIGLIGAWLFAFWSINHGLNGGIETIIWGLGGVSLIPILFTITAIWLGTRSKN